jgi:selenocysteine lyase/cysteine desulfurase
MSKISEKPGSLVSLHPKIRGRFPQIDRDQCGNRRIYLNNAAGSLTVDTAIEALTKAAAGYNPMPGAVCPSEIATGQFHWRVREIVADFLNAAGPAEITFHFSSTNALFNLAFSLQNSIRPHNNLIVTDLDHLANVNPWERNFGRLHGCEIHRARITADGRLDIDHLLSLVDPKTALVALPMASNAFGTIVPLKEAIALIKAKSASCLVCVDAVHHALHGPIDVREIDCDFLVFSGYKVFGPMLGILWGKEHLLRKLEPYRVETNKSEPPYKFEMGMLNNAALASLEAALEYLLWLGNEMEAVGGSLFQDRARRSLFRTVMTSIADYERGLSRYVLEEFLKLDLKKFGCFGITNPSLCQERDPTFAFDIAGLNAREIKQLFWDRSGIQIADGNHYSAAVVRHLGRDSLCRASFAHYDNPETARAFVKGVEELIQ